MAKLSRKKKILIGVLVFLGVSHFVGALVTVGYTYLLVKCEQSYRFQAEEYLKEQLSNDSNNSENIVVDATDVIQYEWDFLTQFVNTITLRFEYPHERLDIYVNVYKGNDEHYETYIVTFEKNSSKEMEITGYRQHTDQVIESQ